MASGSRKAALRLVGWALLARILTSRGFYAALAVGAISVVALGRIGKESGGSTLERLAAWDRRQVERARRKAERQARAVQGGGRMVRRRATRGLADAMAPVQISVPEVDRPAPGINADDYSTVIHQPGGLP
jgi:hypothetical protein